MAMSPADRQVQANEDVERLAWEMYCALNRAYLDDRPTKIEFWGSEVFADMRERWKAVALDLLHRDVIRVGHRPNAERPMEGQIEIDPMSDVPFEDEA